MVGIDVKNDVAGDQSLSELKTPKLERVLPELIKVRLAACSLALSSCVSLSDVDLNEIPSGGDSYFFDELEQINRDPLEHLYIVVGDPRVEQPLDSASFFSSATAVGRQLCTLPDGSQDKQKEFQFFPSMQSADIMLSLFLQGADVDTVSFVFVAPEDSDTGKAVENYTFEEQESFYVMPISPEASLPHFSQVRFFVADGAFNQDTKGSFSRWLRKACDELEERFDRFDGTVVNVNFDESTAIEESAKVLGQLIVSELEDNPLKLNEQFIMCGHSQGAFIFCYLLQECEKDPSFVPGFPVDRVHAFLSVDPPLSVTDEYHGSGAKGIVNFVMDWGRVDPIVMGTLCRIFYPAALDYLEHTDSLKVLENPWRREIRLAREDSRGFPLPVTAPGKFQSDPFEQWDHDPFLLALSHRNQGARTVVLGALAGLVGVNDPSSFFQICLSREARLTREDLQILSLDAETRLLAERE